MEAQNLTVFIVLQHTLHLKVDVNVARMFTSLGTFFAWLLHCEQIHVPYVSRFSPHSCLRWQLSSPMTKSVRTPLHPALFL